MRIGVTSVVAGRTGVILATYGEPRVNSFAQQWVYSYRILRGLTRKVAEIPAPLLPLIATSRAFTRVKLWRENGFVSPLEELHERTVAAVQAHFPAVSGREVIVRAAYEFRRPSLTDAVRGLGAGGCERIIVAPMYISEGDFTHGMTALGIGDAIAATGWPRERLNLCSLGGDRAGEERLAGVLASHLIRSMAERGVEDLSGWAVLLAAHGTVVTPIPGVDNGLRQAGRVLHRLKTNLRSRAGLVRVGWLNHTRGGRWTSPSVPEALEAIRGHGFEKLVYLPWGFTTDNAETVLEGRVALRDMKRPFARIEHLPCLNTGSEFVGLIAGSIRAMLGGPGTDADSERNDGAGHLEPALSA
jgi:protoporphyrin/coproporphyrin ferrochelatase